MEKNGNTMSQGDKVVHRKTGVKYASPDAQGEVKEVDVQEEQVLVKWASGTEEWLPLSNLERVER